MKQEGLRPLFVYALSSSTGQCRLACAGWRGCFLAPGKDACKGRFCAFCGGTKTVPDIGAEANKIDDGESATPTSLAANGDAGTQSLSSTSDITITQPSDSVNLADTTSNSDFHMDGTKKTKAVDRSSTSQSANANQVDISRQATTYDARLPQTMPEIKADSDAAGTDQFTPLEVANASGQKFYRGLL